MKIPTKARAEKRALKAMSDYIREKEAEGFLRVVGDKIIYAEEASA